MASEYIALKRKPFFVAILMFSVCFASDIIAKYIVSIGIAINYKPHVALLAVIALSFVFESRLREDMGKYKKWLFILQTAVGAFYLVDAMGMFIVFAEGYVKRRPELLWWATVLLIAFSFAITELARKKVTKPIEPPSNEQSPPSTGN